jgi:hypothetical protein
MHWASIPSPPAFYESSLKTRIKGIIQKKENYLASLLAVIDLVLNENKFIHRSLVLVKIEDLSKILRHKPRRDGHRGPTKTS